MPRRVLVLAIVAALGLVAVAAALPARKPTPAERSKLVQAIRLYVDTSDCCTVLRRIKVLDVRVSTVDRRWASMTIEGYDTTGQAVGVVGASLHRGYLTGRWSVRSFGSSDVGCVIPVRARRDLQLTCP